MNHEGSLTIRNARLVTCKGLGTTPSELLGIIDHGAVVIEQGTIAWLGVDSELPRAATRNETIDARGRVVMPGLVDPHTHLVYGGSRVSEFARKMAGEDYRSIAKSGGGILSTVRATRAASDEELFQGAKTRALAMRDHGVTTIECKSGYGLTLEHELRLLRVARQLGDEGLVRIEPTLLAAHTLPPEFADDRAGYVDLVVGEIIPHTAKHDLARACDVYLDQNAFTREESARVLTAARAAGMQVKAHVGQFADLDGPALLSELGALSGDHLEEVSDEGLRAMAEADVTAVLLPGAWTTLRQKAPDAARMRAAGLRIAIGSDCNPGTSPCTDLTLCLALAVRDAGLTIEEALLGVTAHAARALGRTDVGTLRVGARGDVAVYDFEDPRELGYRLGDVRVDRMVFGGALIA